MEKLGEVMDCDCELLHNEPPSIPVYLFSRLFFLNSHHLLASTLLSHTHIIVHAYVRQQGTHDVCEHTHTLKATHTYAELLTCCRMVWWPAGVSSGLVLQFVMSCRLWQLVHSLSVTAVSHTDTLQREQLQ